MNDTDIRRTANGSIDTAYYMALGRQARSDQAYHLAAITRASTRDRFGALRAALRVIIPSLRPNPA